MTADDISSCDFESGICVGILGIAVLLKVIVLLLLFIMFACETRLYERGEPSVKENERHSKIRGTEHEVINLSIESA